MPQANLKQAEKQIRDVFKSQGLIPEDYIINKIREQVREQIVRETLDEFFEPTGLHQSDEDQKAIKNLETEKEMVAALEKLHPKSGIAKELVLQIVSDLRLETPGYYQREPGQASRKKTLEELQAELKGLHAKKITAFSDSFYGLRRKIARFDKWLTGKDVNWDSDDSVNNDEAINAKLQGCRIKSFQNGRVDIFVKDEAKKAELLKIFFDNQIARYKRWLENE